MGTPKWMFAIWCLKCLASCFLITPHKRFAVGDANEEPGDSCIQSVLEGCQGSILSTGTPTRFSGDGELVGL